MKNSKFKFALVALALATGVTAVSVYSCEKENIVPGSTSEVDAEQSVSELKLTIADPDQVCGTVSERYLITNAGKKIGKAFYYNDAKNFYVQLMTIRGYYMTATNMHICGSHKEFPLNADGNPAVSEFKYLINGDPLTNVRKFVVPIRDLNEKSYVAIAATVKLLKKGEEKVDISAPSNIIRIWAEGKSFGENRLGKMFIYDQTTCELGEEHIVADPKGVTEAGDGSSLPNSKHPGQVNE